MRRRNVCLEMLARFFRSENAPVATPVGGVTLGKEERQVLRFALLPETDPQDVLAWGATLAPEVAARVDTFVNKDFPTLWDSLTLTERDEFRAQILTPPVSE